MPTCPHQGIINENRTHNIREARAWMERIQVYTTNRRISFDLSRRKTKGVRWTAKFAISSHLAHTERAKNILSFTRFFFCFLLLSHIPVPSASSAQSHSYPSYSSSLLSHSHSLRNACSICHFHLDWLCSSHQGWPPQSCFVRLHRTRQKMQVSFHIIQSRTKSRIGY